MNSAKPSLSVIIPTHNNLPILKQCLARWLRYARTDEVEILVIEDGCTDGTAEYLAALVGTKEARGIVKWFHEPNVNELASDNRGFAEAKSNLFLAWQDDMLLECSWLAPELVETFSAHPDIGLIALSRGLNMFPAPGAIETYADLIDWSRLRSTIGEAPFNWVRLTEVDAVVRPWVVRRECIEKVGPLDEAFRPNEWDEVDLCFRIRSAGWRIATHGYERDHAFVHLGSTTLSRTPSERQQAVALEHGMLVHSRWHSEIELAHARQRKRWSRRFSPGSALGTARSFAATVLSKRS